MAEIQYDSRGNPILSYGIQGVGGNVAWLKQVMNWWGYYDPNHPDAAAGAESYGWDIATAVAKFQSRYGLSGNGVVDEQTWGMIDQLQRGIDPTSFSGTVQQGPPTTRGDQTPGAPAAPGTPTPSGPGANNNNLQRDALARLGQLLNQYGLGGMLDWVRSKLIAGASEAEIQLELYDQPAFKARFPVIAARQAAGLTPVSVAEVLEYEQRGRELLRRAGVTAEQFKKSEYLQDLMAKDVSLSEVQDRLNEGLMKITEAPAEVRVVFGNYFGTNGDAALAQLFLDPEKALPELEKMASTAFAGGIAERYGIQLAQGIAREIADTGASDAAIWQGFANIDSMRNLFTETISETQDMTAQGEGVAAAFGTQPGATQTLQRRAQARTNVLRGGGGIGSTERGVVGLGEADN